MAISPELEAQILRYFHVEKWLPGTIARQLGVHHSTVDRVLCQAGLPKAARPHRPSLIDPYLPFVLQTLEQYSWNGHRAYPGKMWPAGWRPGGASRGVRCLTLCSPPARLRIVFARASSSFGGFAVPGIWRLAQRAISASTGNRSSPFGVST